MKKEAYFEEVKSIGRRIEGLKTEGGWVKFFEGYYTGMLTGIQYLFMTEFCSDDEVLEEFKILCKEVEDKIYENKSI